MLFLLVIATLLATLAIKRHHYRNRKLDLDEIFPLGLTESYFISWDPNLYEAWKQNFLSTEWKHFEEGFSWGQCIVISVVPESSYSSMLKISLQSQGKMSQEHFFFFSKWRPEWKNKNTRQYLEFVRKVNGLPPMPWWNF